MSYILLFGVPENPLIWLVILAAIFLLFGGSRLPQLAKALGQSKRAFREGQEEAEAEARLRQQNQIATGAAPPPTARELDAVDDEALFEEARRRAARLRANEGATADKPSART